MEPIAISRSRGLIAASAHRPSDLAEAVAATARRDGVQIEIQLGHLCNNKCLFCVSGQMTQEGFARPVDLEPVFAALAQGRRDGVRRVTFLGGEPTIHPQFLDVLAEARRLGFEDIVIFTNGVRGKQHGYLERIAALGRFTFRISIQGGDRATHDLVVGRDGAFDKIEAALAWLRDHDQPVTVNACVNAHSASSMVGLLDLTRRYRIRQVHLDTVRPGSTGRRSAEHQRDLLGRYSVIAEGLDRAMSAFAAWNEDFDIRIGNLPSCVLPRWAHRIEHGGTDTVTVSTDDEGRLGRVWDKYEHQRAERFHPEGCARCALRPRCRGVEAQYAAFQGVEEFVPITLATPPGGRVGQAIAALSRVAPFDGFGIHGLGAEPDGRSGRVQLVRGRSRFDVVVRVEGERLRVTFESADGWEAAREAVAAVAAALDRQRVPMATRQSATTSPVS